MQNPQPHGPPSFYRALYYDHAFVDADVLIGLTVPCAADTGSDNALTAAPSMFMGTAAQEVIDSEAPRTLSQPPLPSLTPWKVRVDPRPWIPARG